MIRLRAPAKIAAAFAGVANVLGTAAERRRPRVRICFDPAVANVHSCHRSVRPGTRRGSSEAAWQSTSDHAFQLSRVCC